MLTAEPRQIVLVPRIDPNGVLKSVTAVNPTIAPQSRISLLLRNVPETLERAEWIIPGSAPVLLPLLREKSFVRTELPELAAWDIGFLKLTF